MRKILIFLIFFLLPAAGMAQRNEDAERLGKALEYFTSGKYHEALIIFEKLSKEYKLNPRYMAFIGTCYYYDWDYENAALYLDGAIPELKNFAPHERSFYLYANAESHFNMKRYAEALPLYDEMTKLCYDNERPDAHYRMGFCYLFENDSTQAMKYFELALEGYRQYRNTPDMKARITQLQNITAYWHQRKRKEANP